MSARVRWIGLVVFLLLLSVGIQATAFVLSITDPSFAVEPDYERKALHWDDHMRQVERNRRLGWRAEVETAGARRWGDAPLTVDLVDADGLPVEGAEVRVEAFHNARAGRRYTAEARPVGPGRYRALLPLRRPGIWEVRIAARRDQDLFTAVVRTSVGPAEDG